MRSFYVYAAAVVVAAISSNLLSSCSNDDLTSELEETGKEKVLTKHVVMGVKGDSIVPTRASDKNSRFTITLPESGIGTVKYRFSKGEEMSAFTKVNGKYIENKMTCTSTDSITGNAKFEGDLQYTESNRAVYLWLGSHADFYGDEFIYIGLGDYGYQTLKKIFPGSLKGYAGLMFDSTKPSGYPYWPDNPPKYFYQYGKSIIPNDNTPLSIELNMVTTLATIKVDTSMLDKMMNSTVYEFTIKSDASYGTKTGFPERPYFNFETGEVLTDDYYRTYYYDDHQTSYKFGIYNFTKDDIEDIIKNYNGLISIPLLPGYYKNFTISLETTRMGNKRFQWHSTPWSFSTVIGAPKDVDDKANHVFSSNRNFFFGTIDLQPVK